MLFLVGFFFWFAMYQAHLNDARLEKGLPPLEKEDSDKKVFSGPTSSTPSSSPWSSARSS